MQVGLLGYLVDRVALPAQPEDVLVRRRAELHHLVPKLDRFNLFAGRSASVVRLFFQPTSRLRQFDLLLSSAVDQTIARRADEKCT